VGLAVVTLVGAIAVGYALGGSWHRLTQLHLRWRGFVVAAVVAQGGGAMLGLVGAADSRRSYVVGLAVSALCAAAFCARNLRVAGVPLMTLGLALNALVVGINGAMPVSIDAAYRAGVPTYDIAMGFDARHEIAGTGTAVRWLGDVIAVPLPARPEVVSPGDVLVAAGLGELLVVGMLARRRRTGPAAERVPSSSTAPTD
jgi:hypothetical protein